MSRDLIAVNSRTCGARISESSSTHQLNGAARINQRQQWRFLATNARTTGTGNIAVVVCMHGRQEDWLAGGWQVLADGLAPAGKDVHRTAKSSLCSNEWINP